MLKFIIIGILQSLFLTSGQVFLKHSMNKVGNLELSLSFLRSLINIPIFASIASFIVAAGLWLYMLKYYNFSMAYPMTSISYIFGMFASALILHESIPMTRWIGVVIIVIGVFFIIKN